MFNKIVVLDRNYKEIASQSFNDITTIPNKGQRIRIKNMEVPKEVETVSLDYESKIIFVEIVS